MYEIDNNLSDAEVIRAVGSGSKQAYAVLVDRHLRSVYSAALRIVCNQADAEDVTQDTFLRAYERLASYDASYSFRNWLLKMATNLALNHLRSTHRRRGLYLKAAKDRNDRASQTDLVSKVTQVDQLEYWLGQLDERQRTAVVLFHFHQMSYVEIAEALDVPLNTVRTLIHRGRKRLRELISGKITVENGSWNVGKHKA